MRMPFFGHGIVGFTGVRIDNQRQRTQDLQMFQRGGGVAERNTVDAQRHDLRTGRQHFHYPGERGAITQMLVVT